MGILKFLISFFVVSVIFLFILSFIIWLLFSKQEDSSNLVAVMYLKGIIVNEEGEGVIDSKYVLQTLDKIKDNKNYKGILLIIDSPGGVAAPSLEISYKIKKITKDKPVVAYIENLGASGAYYIASSCNYIIANPQAIVGSIGVIITIPQVYKALDKIGISMVSIRSGKYKDSLSPFKEIDNDQKKYIQDLVMEYYKQFVKDVSENRNISIQELYKVADGRVFSPYTAKNYKLIDSIGTIDDAKAKIKQLINIKDIKFKEIKPPKKSFLEQLLGSKLNYNSDLNNYIKRYLNYFNYQLWMI
ncbi:MAG: signal peptide peptidase SppA, partial [bacterium]